MFGLGFGMVTQVLVTAIQNAVERRELGVATATAGFFRALGGAVGAAVLGAVFAAQAGDATEGDGPAGRRLRADVIDGVQAVFAVAAPLAALALLAVLALVEVPLRRRRRRAAERAPPRRRARPRAGRGRDRDRAGVMTVAALYDWLLFGHILAAMVWVGGGVVLAALAVATLRGGDAAGRRALRRRACAWSGRPSWRPPRSPCSASASGSCSTAPRGTSARPGCCSRSR